jgi:hypothetical protein
MPPAERFLIGQFKPIWNTVVKAFATKIEENVASTWGIPFAGAL